MLTALPVQKGTSGEDEVKSLYYAAFPSIERVRLNKLLRRAKSAGVSFLRFYDGDVFVGFAYFSHSNDFVYVVYLAVNTEVQSQGYGSRVLEYFEAQYPGARVVLEIEALDEHASNYEQRVKRKAFYEKNGFVSTGMKIVESGVFYEVLIKNGSCTSEEFVSAQKRAFGALSHRFSGSKILKDETK